MKIEVRDRQGTVKAAAEGEQEAILAWEGAYEEGDVIAAAVTQAPGFYVIRVDDAVDEGLVYLTETEWRFLIPFEEKKTSYNPKAFTGERHYLTIRGARGEELSVRRNLARNPLDQHGDPGCYPHASANVETRGEAVFAARNAIDGIKANRSHGSWPYESWGINRQDDAMLTLSFGRPVDIDEIVLYTRADFPHDNWWEQATITFSDGSSELLRMEKQTEPHRFAIRRQGISELSLGALKKADDPSPFPALTQIEVYGTEQGAGGSEQG